jgi:cobalt-zinc-cadmium efflux system membrane fusion protein
MLRNYRIVAAILVVLALLGVTWIVSQWDHVSLAKWNASAGNSASQPRASLGTTPEQTQGIPTVGIGTETKVGIVAVEVRAAPPPERLRLSGSTLLDPNSMVRIHARFPGELVSVGTMSAGDASRADEIGAVAPRPLQYGDRVFKGDVLAVVRSKDLGEKKSEYVDAISQLDIDAALLARYEAVQEGVLSQRALFEARRAVEADRIAVEKAERTLRSWRLTEAELQELRDEAKRVQKREGRDVQGDREWAETVIRSPINGIVMEKNFNMGDLVDPSQDLLKIADLDRVQVMANAYEEDLPLLKNLKPEQRKWRIDIKADPHDVPIEGTFEIVGSIIDPTQHAGAILGWIDNPTGSLSIGEFLNATIDLPPDPTLVVIPTSALIEDSQATQVLVTAHEDQFECRPVAVVSRGRERTYIRSQPTPEEQADGARPLNVGERVVTSGALELFAEMQGRKGPTVPDKLAPHSQHRLSKMPRVNPVSPSGGKDRLKDTKENRS